MGQNEGMSEGQISVDVVAEADPAKIAAEIEKDLTKAVKSVNIPDVPVDVDVGPGVEKAKKGLGGVKSAIGEVDAEVGIGAQGAAALGGALGDVGANALAASLGIEGPFVEAASSFAGAIAEGIIATQADKLAKLASSAATVLWSGVSKAAAAAQWLLNAALAANPIGLVVIALIALVAGLVIAYKKSETFREIVDAAFRAISDAAIWLWEKAIKPLIDGWVDAFQWAIYAVQVWWDKVTDLWSKIADVAVSLGKSIADMVTAAVDKVKEFIDWWAELPGKILGALGDVGKMLYESGKKIVQGLIDGVQDMIGKVGDIMGNVTGKVRDFLPFSPAKEGPLSGDGSPENSGRKIASGIATGMQKGSADLLTASASMTGNVSAGAQTGGIRVWDAPAQRNEPIRITGDGTKLANFLVQLLAENIRNQYGGNVQLALGGAR